MIEAIVAVYSNWGIGLEGSQPLVIREDRRHFRDVTQGAAVITGRRTLADFPGGRPLKNRVNIVLSRSLRELEGAVVAPDIPAALAEAAKYEKVFVIGGESVYKALLPHTQRVYVTKIDAAPHCDAFFPDLDSDPDWYAVQPGEELTSEGIHYKFMVYERRTPDAAP